MKAFFNKSLLISFLGHLTIFSLFSFSFGIELAKLDYANINFLGSTLKNYDFFDLPVSNHPLNNRLLYQSALAIVPTREFTNSFSLNLANLKPIPKTVFIEKQTLKNNKEALATFPIKRKEAVITFHPNLPYDFFLYFKDRQVAHIELLFNLSKEDNKEVLIKRKISSGNLEVDLLSMRYISHYLFIQQLRLPKDTWQSMKIEISAKQND